MGIYMF